MATTGYGIGPYGGPPYGGGYYVVSVTLHNSHVVEVDARTEAEKCQDRVFNKLIKRIPKWWRNTLKDENSIGYKLFRTFAYQICILLEDANVALEQINLLTATEFWLDYWGEYFKTQKYNGETDKSYRKRIVSSVKKLKSTKEAILDKINPYLAEEPQIVEYMYDGVPFSSFTPDSVEDFLNRRAKMEIVFSALEPIDRYFFVDYTYVGRESFEPGLEEREAYIFNTERIGQTESNFETIKDIVNKTKQAGVRVFYRVGNNYLR